MDSRTALALGSMPATVDDECRLVSKRRIADYDDGTPTITRTLDNFEFKDGPGWALIDHDTKGMSAAVATQARRVGRPRGRTALPDPGL